MSRSRCYSWLGFVALAFAGGLFAVAPAARGEDPKPAESPVKGHEGDEHKAEGEHKADKHGAENQFDLSHANAGPEQGSIVEIKADTAIYSMIVFLLLLAIVTKFAWRPIMDGLNKRESSIAHMIDDAKANQHKAEESLKQYEAKLAAATEETRQLLAQARQDAEAAKEKIIAEAQAAAQRERDKSLAEIRAAKEAALREMAQKSVDTAFSLAGRVLHKEIRPADHAALIAESLAQFPSKN